MAYDEAYADILREALDGTPGLSEKRMFGGLCFMLNGNMLCGVTKDGGMFRVGKTLEPAALEIEGALPLSFTGRKMGGMVEVDDAAFENETLRATLTELSLTNAASLPAKG